MKHNINNRNKLWVCLLLTAVIAACTPAQEKTAGQAAATYTCPMHPQIVQEGPGTCPICGMDLVPVTQTGDQQEIMLSERQIALANIRVAPAGSDGIGNNTFITGKLAADQELIEVISSRVPGRIEKLYVKETGQRIRKGQPLYEIYSEQLLTLQKEYLLTLEQYKALGQEDNRYRPFMEAARKKLLLYGMSEAQIEKLAEAKTLSPNVIFAAKASGIVTEIMTAEGQYVSEGSTLYRTEGLNRLWVEAELYPREAELVKQGDQVQVIIYGYENQPVNGKVVFLNPEYRTGTQILTLRVAIDNPQRSFSPGMQASVVLSSGTRQALALPVDAVVRGEGGAHAWVKTGEGTFEPRMVKTGMETFDKIEILEGLQEGDSVVVSGAYLLYGELVLKKGTTPMAGHTHASHTTQPVPVKNTDQAFSDQLRSLLDPYLQLKDALVTADASRAQQAAGELQRSLRSIGKSGLKKEAVQAWETLGKEMEKGLTTIISQADIDLQRSSFSAVSNALYESYRTFGVKDLDAYYQYCPMAMNNKGAYWISKEKAIKNPYFGEQMLTCGEVKATL